MLKFIQQKTKKIFQELKEVRLCVEDIIISLIILQVILFRFLNIHEFINKIIVVLVAYYFIKSKFKYFFEHIAVLKTALVFILVILLNAVVYGIKDYFFSNILILFYPFVHMFFINYYVEKKGYSIYKKLYDLRYTINVYMILNVIVLIIQTLGFDFMLGFSDIKTTAWWDELSGLFGYMMSATLCFFTIFVFLYNMFVLKTITNDNYKKKFIIYNVVLVLVVSILFSVGDNIAFFLLLPLCFFSLLFLEKGKKLLGIKINFKMIVMLIVALSFCLILIPQLRVYIYDNIVYKFVGIFENMFNGPNVQHGSLERFALIVYALTDCNGFLLGKGVSFSGLYTPNTLGFVHFGNANAGAIIALGGIWLYILLLALYLKMNMYCFIDKKAKGKTYSLILGLLYMFCSSYSLIFTDISISIVMQFIIIAIWLNVREDYLKQLKGEC